MPEKTKTAAFICSRDTLDGSYPALLLGINAVRMGLKTKVFCTFMGLNILRPGHIAKAKFHMPGFMGAMPGMSSMATSMMKSKIDAANVPPLEDMLEMAMLEGVELIACRMTVDMMTLDPKDFIDGVIIETAEEFLKYAIDCDIALFT